jgi:hypothetical protein
VDNGSTPSHPAGVGDKTAEDASKSEIAAPTGAGASLPDSATDLIPDSPATEAPLEIHKPKPVHSWREFLSEIGVIVIGVLIALSGEQTVEWLHWRSEVAETREALNAELARAVGSFQYRLTLSGCVSRRLDELDGWLRTSHPGDALKATRPISAPISWSILTSAWDVAKSGQNAAHMPLAERLRYAHIYGALGNFREGIAHESDAWRTLDDFDQPEPLDHADRMRMRGAIESARRTTNMVRGSAPYIMPDVQALGVTPERRTAALPEQERSFCSSLLAPPNVVHR